MRRRLSHPHAATDDATAALPPTTSLVPPRSAAQSRPSRSRPSPRLSPPTSSLIEATRHRPADHGRWQRSSRRLKGGYLFGI